MCSIVNLLFLAHRRNIHDSSERKVCVAVCFAAAFCRRASLASNSFSIYFNRKKPAQREVVLTVIGFEKKKIN